MKAIVISGPARADLRDVAPDPLGPDDVRIRLLATGICGTDVEIFDGTMPYYTGGMASYPVIPGHEWVGEVVEAGAARHLVQGRRSRRWRVLGRLHDLHHLHRRRLSPLPAPHRDGHPQPERRLRRIHHLPVALPAPHLAVGSDRERRHGRAGGGRLQRRPAGGGFPARRGCRLRRWPDRPSRRDDGVGLRRGADHRGRRNAPPPRARPDAWRRRPRQYPRDPRHRRCASRRWPEPARRRHRGDGQSGGSGERHSVGRERWAASCFSASSPDSARRRSTSTGW